MTEQTTNPEPDGMDCPPQCGKCGQFFDSNDRLFEITADLDPGDAEVGPQPDVCEIGVCLPCYAELARTVRVKLTGTDDNAFSVLGLCGRAMRKAGWSADAIKAAQAEMMAGDYNRLLQTAMKYFDVR